MGILVLHLFVAYGMFFSVMYYFVAVGLVIRFISCGYIGY